LVVRYHENRGRRWLVAATVLVFIGSNYLIYGPLLMIFAFWILGATVRLLPFRILELSLFAAAGAAALALHLSQTIAVVGPSVFAQELWFTLGNRMIGSPSRSELETFYDSIGFVLYGGHAFSPSRFANALNSAVAFPGRGAILGLVVILAAVALSGGPRTTAAAGIVRTSKLLLWLLPPVAVPTILFPAFASDYGLSGTNQFLLGLFVVGVMGSIAAAVRSLPPGAARRLLTVMVAATVVWIGALQCWETARVARQAYRWLSEPTRFAPLWTMARDLRGKVVMTNVDPTVVGFFTREVAFGGCPHAAIDEGPLPARCAVRFIRGWPATVTERPAAFVWFASGNAFCSGATCVDRAALETRYRRITGTELIAIYDLSRTAR
jgi:hypothetical protein